MIGRDCCCCYRRIAIVNWHVTIDLISRCWNVNIVSNRVTNLFILQIRQAYLFFVINYIAHFGEWKLLLFRWKFIRVVILNLFFEIEMHEFFKIQILKKTSKIDNYFFLQWNYNITSYYFYIDR